MGLYRSHRGSPLHDKVGVLMRIGDKIYVKGGYIAVLSGDDFVVYATHNLTLADLPGNPLELGTMLTSQVCLLTPDGEDWTPRIRKQFPNLIMIYPWSRRDFDEYQRGVYHHPVRMNMREGSDNFQKAMAPYGTGSNNPNHFWWFDESIAVIKLAF